jgi:hypothetical protein
LGDLRALRAALERPRPAPPPEPRTDEEARAVIAGRLASLLKKATELYMESDDPRSGVDYTAEYLAANCVSIHAPECELPFGHVGECRAHIGGSAGTGAAPTDAQAGVELVESSRLPQCIEDAKTGSAVDSAKSPTNSPSYALFDLFSRGAPRPFVGVDQKPDGCWFACIASLTGIPLDDFPDPPTKDTESDVRNVVTKVLHAHGWQLHRLYTIPDAVPRGWAIAGGTSPRNLAHAVVMYDGELVWDPHPSRAGLAAIEEYEVLVPVRAGNALPVRGGAAQPPPSAPRCSKCNGAGWARGRELDDADDKTYADTMTKYTCDWCGGSGVPREETNHE